MIYRHVAGTGAMTPDHVVVFRLTVVIAAYALLAFTGKRRWIRPVEVYLVGGAEIFWALAWLVSPVILVVRSHILDRDKALWLSFGLVTPVLLAMGVGLRFIGQAAGTAVENSVPVKAKVKSIR